MDTGALQEVQEEEYEVDSLTADLAAAWDDTEGEGDADLHQSQEFTEASSEPAQIDGSTKSEERGQADAAGVQGLGQASNLDEANKADDGAPLSLSPSAREAWKDVPDVVKTEIAKREKDYEAGVVKYAHGAKRAAGMDAMLQPYQQYTAMNGGPGQTIKTLLQTGAQLQMGTPIQKAQMVAGLISQFGIDIRQLDSLLVGQAPKENPQDAINQQIQQAVAPYQQQMQQWQQAQQYQAQQQQGHIAQEVGEFGSKNEFYNDVREYMADALDLAANRGKVMTMDEAYKIGCQMHPEISKIMTTRSKTPTGGQRRAASSISGGRGGDVSSTGGGSMTDDILAAWDNAGKV